MNDQEAIEEHEREEWQAAAIEPEEDSE